jgi:hypothetical protein
MGRGVIKDRTLEALHNTGDDLNILMDGFLFKLRSGRFQNKNRIAGYIHILFTHADYSWREQRFPDRSGTDEPGRDEGPYSD